MRSAFAPSLLAAFVATLVATAAPARAQQAWLGELRRMLPADGDAISELALGDIDGDGDEDLWAVHSSGLVTTRLYRADGNGGFVDATIQLPPSGARSEAIALGDVDLDGDLDALIGKADSQAVPPFGILEPIGAQNRLFLNGGFGIYADGTALLPQVLDHTQAAAFADLDADGDLDALIGNLTLSGFMVPTIGDRLMLGNGSGAFTDAAGYPPGGPSGTTHSIAVDDVDADGDIDALLTRSGSPGAVLRRNDGAAHFSQVASDLPALPAGPGLLVDVDGDGDPDALSSVRLYKNDGAGHYTDASSGLPAVPDNPGPLAAGDIDGDGDIDAATCSNPSIVLGPDPALLWKNQGGGIFVDASAGLPPLAHAGLPLLADVDGDDDLDLLYGHNKQDELYLGDGLGSFGASGPMAEVGGAVALADVDGDGDPDALVGSEPVLLYTNDGSGALAPAPAAVPALLGETRGLAFADFDLDGDADAWIAKGGFDSPQDCVYRNDGLGQFADVPGAVPAESVNANDVELADLDGDGDPDAFVGNSGSKRYYRNDGTGLFADASAQLPDAFADGVDAVGTADLDLDGDVDVLLGCTSSERVYLNDGTGSFAAGATPPSSSQTQALALGDLDLDGDPDVVLAEQGPDRVFLNDGAGGFGTQAPSLPADPDSSLAFGLWDIDGDGDLDLYAGTAPNAATLAPPDRLYLGNGAAGFAHASGTLLTRPAVRTNDVAVADLDGDGDRDAVITCYDGQGARVLSNLTRQLARRALPRVAKPLTLELRGPPSGSWFLGASVLPASVPLPPLGTLKLDLGLLLATAAGSLNGQGVASATYFVPVESALIGFTVYWQALVGPPLRFTGLEPTLLTVY